jgi:hypothetical protein
MARDEVTPNFPPTRIVIDVPLDGEPKVVDDGGLTWYLLEAVLTRVAEQYQTVYEIVPSPEGDDT